MSLTDRTRLWSLVLVANNGLPPKIISREESEDNKYLSNEDTKGVERKQARRAKK